MSFFEILSYRLQEFGDELFPTGRDQLESGLRDRCTHASSWSMIEKLLFSPIRLPYFRRYLTQVEWNVPAQRLESTRYISTHVPTEHELASCYFS